MFKRIENHPNYFINESGNIIDSNETFVRFSVNNNERMYCTLDGKVEYIDQLVANAFLAKPEDNTLYLNHQDGDSLNCHVSNLHWSDVKIQNDPIPHREHREYSRGTNIYEVFNDDESIVVTCVGRSEVAELIQYEEISLKNMVGNGRKIFLGPYKGFQIRRVTGR